MRVERVLEREAALAVRAAVTVDAAVLALVDVQVVSVGETTRAHVTVVSLKHIEKWGKSSFQLLKTLIMRQAVNTASNSYDKI